MIRFCSSSSALRATRSSGRATSRPSSSSLDAALRAATPTATHCCATHFSSTAAVASWRRRSSGRPSMNPGKNTTAVPFLGVNDRSKCWNRVLPPWQGCSRREGTSEAAPGAVRQAVGGGGQSGWGRLLSVTNAVEAGTWRQGDSGIGWAPSRGGLPPPLPMHP